MAKPETIRAMLAVGRNRLDVGRVCEVAKLVLAHPRRVGQLVECLWDSDAGVANRAADVLERVSYQKPALLAPWKEALLGLLSEAEHNKLRWNLALMLPRAELTVPETVRAMENMRSYLNDHSSIVKTAAMQCMAGLAWRNAALLPEVLDTLRMLSRSGTPAMRARGRILLEQFEKAARRTTSNRRSWPSGPHGLIH